jgi:hypothetical protein
MWTALIGPIAELAGGFIKNKQETVQAKQTAMKASDNSWKDELWTVFFVLLIAACFVPAAQPYIEDGFRFLREDCPDWLSWGILASIGASFGLKSIGQFKK